VKRLVGLVSGLVLTHMCTHLHAGGGGLLQPRGLVRVMVRRWSRIGCTVPPPHRLSSGTSQPWHSTHIISPADKPAALSRGWAHRTRTHCNGDGLPAACCAAPSAAAPDRCLRPLCPSRVGPTPPRTQRSACLLHMTAWGKESLHLFTARQKRLATQRHRGMRAARWRRRQLDLCGLCVQERATLQSERTEPPEVGKN
jgi:hypothetical protein